jgi:hypothetical protein
VLASEIEHGLQAHVPVEVTVEINEGQIGGDHAPILPRGGKDE